MGARSFGGQRLPACAQGLAEQLSELYIYTVGRLLGSNNQGHAVAIDATRACYSTGALGVPADVYVAKLARSGETGVDGGRAAVELLQNSPNPFNPATETAFELPAASEVTLRISRPGGAARFVLVSLCSDEPCPLYVQVVPTDSRPDPAGT